MTKHPIIPPPELAQQWMLEAHHKDAPPGTCPDTRVLIARSAQWGADQELDGCCEWLRSHDILEPAIDALRAVRRPKPPSAIEQAESLIERHMDGWVPNPAEWNVIREGLAEGRRALEALPDD
jgi:hypothetical protein